jgi:predicted nucleic acid-binding protein
MPNATEHAFTDEPLPSAVALDADFLINVLNEAEEYHKPCLQFATRLAAADTTVICSPVLRLEVLRGWQKAATSGGITIDLLQQKLLIPDPIHLRRLLLHFGDDALSSFLAPFRQYEVRLSARLFVETREVMANYGLKPMDACFLAAAERVEVQDIVSLDSDFRRVDGIHLWNDNIPAKRQAARRRKRS